MHSVARKKKKNVSQKLDKITVYSVMCNLSSFTSHLWECIVGMWLVGSLSSIFSKSRLRGSLVWGCWGSLAHVAAVVKEHKQKGQDNRNAF